MTQDWSKTDSGLACVLSAIVTAIAVILAVVYTWRKRQQTADAEPKVHVNWPTESENAVTEGDSEGDEAVDDVISPELRDPVEFCSHIPAEVRKATQKVAMKKIEEDMSQEQKESERVIQREQLEAIFNLMADQEDKFGINTMDAMQDQMKLYSM